MHLALVQPDTAWEDREANFRRVDALLARRPPPAGALVVLPEMFAVGFSMNVAAIHEGEARPTERFLADLARRYDACVVGGLVTRGADGRGRNEALAVGPDGAVLARYAKIHPFSYAGETDHYTSGEEVVTFTWQGMVVAPFICYDLRFPEIYRIAAARGAECLVTIANWPSPRVAHWTALLTARAIENQAFVVGVNRCGDDPTLTYPGRSTVVDPRGRTIADLEDAEDVLEAEIDRSELVRYRQEYPFLKDLRPDLVKVDSLQNGPWSSAID